MSRSVRCHRSVGGRIPGLLGRKRMLKSATSDRSLAKDSGASAVEFAILVPVLVLLLVGMFEFAFVMRDWASISTSVRVGARTAIVEVGDLYPCASGLGSTCIPALAQGASDAMETAGYGLPKSSIQYILVYKANDKGFPGSAGKTSMPDKNCQIAGSTVSNCVSYVWSTTANDGAGGFVRWAGYLDSSQLNACLPTPDDIGVYMSVSHPLMTRMFGATIPMSDRAVMRISPLNAGCAAGAHK